VVMVKVWPSCSSTSPSTNRPRRIFGPWRSTRTATARPEAWAAARTRWYTSACSEASPWLRLIRATSIPASTRAWIWSADSVAGPMVHTIFALRMVVTLSPESDPARGTFASADVPLGRLSAQRGDVRPDRRAGRRHRHRQVRPAAQVTVHRCRAGPPLGDRPHDERLSTAGVPGDEHAGHGRGERLVVCDTPTLVDLDPELLDEALPGHTLEADGDEDELGGDDPLGALDRRRGPVRVPHHLDHPQVGHLPLAGGAVGEELERRRPEHALAALLVGGGDGEDPRVHRPRLAGGPLVRPADVDVDLRHRARTLALRGAEAVRAGVAAADDDDVLAGGEHLVRHLV